jgi:FtsH-binding integral membrane protein
VKENPSVPNASVLARDAEPAIRAAFLRRTLGQLAGAAGGFVGTAAVVALLLPSDAVRASLRDTPLAVVLVVASLGAAWLARYLADVDAPRPVVALGLHAAFQGIVLAPLAAVALDWLGAWAALPAGVVLLSVLAATRRVTRFHLTSQPTAAALAISASPADPVWFVCRTVRCAVYCRD